jgi:hypothetical protein
MVNEQGIVLDDTSPLGNVAATVEDNGRVVYFYLHFLENGEPQGDMRACWVRNRVPGTARLEVDDMDQGQAPLMPASDCAHPQGAAPLKADALRIVWFEEGNGAALLEGDSILAIIPPWSGEGGFWGFARDCTSAENPLAWPLTAENALHDRVRRAEEYWRMWDVEDFWRKFASALIEPLEARLGEHSHYYGIDRNEWPPKALLRFDLPEHYILITVGVSLLPQPAVERYVEDPAPHRRIELAAAIDRQCPEKEVMRMGSYLSGQSRYPWTCWNWLGDGHTMPCDSFPKTCGGDEFPAALLCAQPPGAPQFEWPAFRGDPINLLWFLPITRRERDWAEEHSSSELLEKLRAAGNDVVIRSRNELRL